jgi:probable HAF family extracellular repeat protein
MLALFVALVIDVAQAADSTPPSYKITDISAAPFGGLPSDHDDRVHPSIAWGLSAKGDAVGEAFIPGSGGYGFFFADGKAKAIACPPPALVPTLQCRDVNAKGQVVGYFANVDRNAAFLWERNALRDLGDPLHRCHLGD